MPTATSGLKNAARAPDGVRRCSKSSCIRPYTAVSALRRPPSTTRSLVFEAACSHVIKIFFALWPEDAAREQLYRLAKQLAMNCEGRRIRQENLHLTLLFIGDLESSVVPELCKAISAIHHPAFELVLDRIAYWKRAGVVVAEASQYPVELAALVQDLGKALSALNIQYDARDFKPHITLVRCAKNRMLPDLTPAVSWKVTGWSLVQSQSIPGGIAYRALASWLLKPCPG